MPRRWRWMKSLFLCALLRMDTNQTHLRGWLLTRRLAHRTQLLFPRLLLVQTKSPLNRPTLSRRVTAFITQSTTFPRTLARFPVCLPGPPILLSVCQQPKSNWRPHAKMRSPPLLWLLTSPLLPPIPMDMCSGCPNHPAGPSLPLILLPIS